MKLQRDPTTGKVARDSTTGKASYVEEANGCGCGCNNCPCAFRCLTVEIVAYDPLPDLIGSWHLSLGNEVTPGFCLYAMFCEQNFTYESVHYVGFSLTVGLLRHADGRVGIYLVDGYVLADDGVSHHPLPDFFSLSSPLYATNPGCDQIIEWEPATGQEFSFSFSTDDCEDNTCTDNGCDTCCPDVICIEAEVTTTSSDTDIWPSDIFIINCTRVQQSGGIWGRGPGCWYYGQCKGTLFGDLPADAQISVWFHIYCNLEGEPVVDFTRVNISRGYPPPFPISFSHDSVATDTPLTLDNCADDISPTMPDITITSESVTVNIGLTANMQTECLNEGACNDPVEILYRQVANCETDELLDLWLPSTEAAAYPGAFTMVATDDTCYYFAPQTSPTPGTLLNTADITAVFDDCAACEAEECDDGCHECDACPEYCADDGQTYLSMHIEIPGGECGSCADYGDALGDGGCRRCYSCEPDPVTGQPSGGSCTVYTVFSDSACLAHDPPGHIVCLQPCMNDDGANSPCSYMVFIGDLELPLVSHTTTTMTFQDTVSLGIYGNMDITVVFHCDTLTYDFSFTIDGRDASSNQCVAERSIDETDGTGVDCDGIDFGFNIPLEDIILGTTCTGNGVSISGVEITRNGC